MHDQLPREPLVSVVIANYNYARFLPQAIESVLAQTYKQIELIVVDDGSTDESRELLAGYGTRVQAVLQQNAGQAAAFSAGVVRSKGELVGLLDADDGWYPDKVQRVVNTFREQPQAQWLRHKLAVVDERLDSLRSTVPAFSGSGYVPPDPLLLIEQGLRAGTTLVMRRELALRIFPVVVTPELALDADDTIILASIFEQRAPGYSLDAVLGFYRRHGGTRFDSNDLPRSLRREAALAAALGERFGLGRPSSSYKLAAVVAALEGSRWWQSERIGNYARGLRSAQRLWPNPKLCVRQVLALTSAYMTPNLWVRRLLSRAVPPTPVE